MKTTEQILIDRIQELIDYSFAGRKSPVFISGTSPVSITNGYVIYPKEDSVISAITYNANAGSATLVGETLLAGIPVYLNGITSITLTSGAVFVHEK